MSVPAGRLSRCRPRLETLSSAPVSRRVPRLTSVTTSKYASLWTAVSIGAPIARSARSTSFNQGDMAVRNDSRDLI